MDFVNESHQLQYNHFISYIKSKKERAIIYLLTSIECSNEMVSQLYSFDGSYMKYNQKLFEALNNEFNEKKRMIIAVAFNLFNGADVTDELNLSRYDYGIDIYSVLCVLGKEMKVVRESLAILEDE
ncbi:MULTISPECIES: DUF6075 family protein [Bacillus]|uniref:Uncharacterized protein n=2 Tax=Bacillus thuringiensis TaxID=1428 RepID=A0A9X6VCU3_BACTU|nr:MULTISPECIES: DUF6075 family protein [Bacillus]MEC0048435.1 hypothetical protein [Bacillus cereus]AFV21902.1 hypothetical protein BTB_502p05970 [Bacillus thuringiensis Bt407]ERI00920.1 hypothetical protein BTCBT_002475 [Bacillus thuringiensis T01-328]MBN6707689.1 hypothetical protein [Bacillus thuringiensis]MDN7078483.1 hypothetical protein [Bacillus thuringiensis]